MSMPDPMSSALAEFMTVVAHVRKAMHGIEGPYHVGVSTDDWRGTAKVDSDGNEHLDLTVRLRPELDRIKLTIAMDTESIR